MYKMYTSYHTTQPLQFSAQQNNAHQSSQLIWSGLEFWDAPMCQKTPWCRLYHWCQVTCDENISLMSGQLNIWKISTKFTVNNYHGGQKPKNKMMQYKYRRQKSKSIFRLVDGHMVLSRKVWLYNLFGNPPEKCFLLFFISICICICIHICI